MSKGTFVCVICGDMDYGYGNNPAPLSALPRKCCDVCNTIHVIPARMNGMYAQQQWLAFCEEEE